MNVTNIILLVLLIIVSVIHIVLYIRYTRLKQHVILLETALREILKDGINSGKVIVQEVKKSDKLEGGE